MKLKRHFVDPSISAAALRATPDTLLRDLETVGLSFESLAIRDLRACADTVDARVHHCRDAEGLEVDAVVRRPDGRWAACEVKLGGRASLDQAAADLARLRNRLDPAVWAETASLNILTAWAASYRRHDGVQVIALGHLDA